jgi:hypothetical protein
MIVKFLSSKKSRGAGAVDYVLSEKKHLSSPPKILRGNEKITKDIIEGIKYKQKATFGVLSFQENDIPTEQKEQLMNEFEELIFAGLPKNDTNILWVEHRDKDRLELNFIIPKINLRTKKSYNPYYFKQDQKRIDTWKRIKNIEYGYHDPDNPENSQTFTKTKNKEFNHNIETLEMYILQAIENNSIQNRNELISYIEDSGVTINRKSKDSISIKFSNSKKAIRLKGGIYGEKFTSIESITGIIEEQRNRIEEYKREKGARKLKSLQNDLNHYQGQKSAYNASLYPFNDDIIVSSNNELQERDNTSISELLNRAEQDRAEQERMEREEEERRIKSIMDEAKANRERERVAEEDRLLREREAERNRKLEEEARERAERERILYEENERIRREARKERLIYILEERKVMNEHRAIRKQIQANAREHQARLRETINRATSDTQATITEFDKKHDRATQSFVEAIRGLGEKILELGKKLIGRKPPKPKKSFPSPSM